MREDRVITPEHIYAKARIFSEGAIIDGEDTPPFAQGLGYLAKARRRNNLCTIPPIAPQPPEIAPEQVEAIWSATSRVLKASASESKPSSGMRFTFDGSGLTTFVHANPYSRLVVEQDGDRVTVMDGKHVLVSGLADESFDWLDEPISNGLPASTFLPGASNEILNLIFYLSCDNYNTGRGCKYCNLFSNPLSQMSDVFPMALQESWAKHQAEAVKVAIDHGWNGHIALSGGALPPSARARYLDLMRLSLEALRKELGERVFEELDIVYNHYPPEHFEDMAEWKKMGIKRTAIDLEVMDPAYFPVICPGKAVYKPHSFWKDAQDASVEVFGSFANTTGNIVLGIEPMSSVLNGIEERLARGVMPRPVIFCSAPNSEYWGFRPPTADWLMEVTERMATQYVEHIDFGVDSGPIATGPTMLVFDMINQKRQSAA
ncbi:bacteriochlorophyllide c C-7(1)-hydroxylase [Myxococcaceae bacterium]|jgi:hypothetical protein|nr:bacteriochlorophyllide c C-7(1)-hydroxylase [Myxococcaceae bacterium]